MAAIIPFLNFPWLDYAFSVIILQHYTPLYARFELYLSSLHAKTWMLLNDREVRVIMEMDWSAWYGNEILWWGDGLEYGFQLGLETMITSYIRFSLVDLGKFYIHRLSCWLVWTKREEVEDDHEDSNI